MIDNAELDMARNYALYTHRNIFLTGKAGTGKTTFLKRLQAESRRRMIVVAPTGVAAINAGGVTIHSFFQLAPGLFLPGKMVAGRDPKSRFSFSRHKQNILRSLSLLVIDEISMVRADLLDAIDDVLRRYQDRSKPFGGVQLLLIGDLQQLAPVATESEWSLLREFYTTPYFFSSLALQQTDFVYIELQHIYRQQDTTFVNLLNNVRDGHVSAATLQALNARYLPAFNPPDGEEWITLTTHNQQAARINAARMSQLPTREFTFEAHIKGDFPESSYPTDPSLKLKVGAQVMFCKNDPSSAKAFYNGRIGRIADIHDGTVTVVCRRTSSAGESGQEQKDYDRIDVKALEWTNTRYTTDAATGTISEEQIGSFTQIPLRTAWAITIHKSQGLTFDHAIINAGQAFSHGQVYVALSRCRTLDGLVLATPITQGIITTDPDVVHFNAVANEHTPTAETFIKDRRSFIEDILCDIFDFRNISMRLRYFERLATEHLSAYFPSFVRMTAATATQTDSSLLAVGVKFQQQIHQLMPLADTFGSNELLRERVRKGMNYYATTTANILGEFFNVDLPEIDNARTREMIASEYQILKASYDEKMEIFVNSLNDFSLEAYWNAKAKTAMTDEQKPQRKARASRKAESKERQPKKTNVRKATIDYETIHNPTLYKALLTWRQQTARERKLPVSYIMPINTVIGITNLMPRTTDELLSVPGIGKKTLQDYGADLLELVASNAFR